MTQEKEDFSIEKFSPAKAEVAKAVQAAEKVDLKDLPAVHAARIDLRDMRVSITKRGKELRDGALKFQKEVISREKELVSMIEPAEDVLAKVEEEAKLRKEMETRREELPTRVAALESVGDGVPPNEEEILAMDDNEFNEYRLRRIDAKLIRDKFEFEESKRLEELAARRREEDDAAKRRELLAAEEAEAFSRRQKEAAELAAKRAELDKEKAVLEAEKRAKAEAEADRQRELDRQEREARLKREADEEAAAKARREDEERGKAAEYLKFLEGLKYDEATDITQVVGDEVRVYRLVGAYKVKK